MSNPREFVMGVGCDFESGNEESFRKYAIENLSGGEKDRMNWMIKNMHLNKSFIYYSKTK